jgi:hypothetical protein
MSDDGSTFDFGLSRREFLLRSGRAGAALALPHTLFKDKKEIAKTPLSKASFEYAAGEVVLPFSYSAKLSPMSKPSGLDFSHQLNPDNCQVFVRMDEELWEFRSQWVINLGTVARYKGPDIDQLSRVEDGTYPDGMSACWFLGGMWYDEQEKKLYAPMHIEHDGPRRMYPFSRKIALATSMDKGRTWRYEGDIVTSETYYYPYDFFKFSGSSYGIGVADFGFYADERGGYFYVFPDEGWAPWSTRGMRWNSRVARCAIGDKMAPGKWSYFYQGEWTESALGGKSSIVAPSHFWGITYSTVLEKYICMFTANQDPPAGENIDGIYIGCCTDLAKQDWVWGHCQEAMFGFMNLINNDGTDVARTSADGFRLYTYFAENDFQRLDFTLTKGQTSVTDLQPRFLFEPHPESSDPTLGRRTRIVGCAHPEVKYTGEWKERNERDSYEGKVKEATSVNSSVEFSFEGTEIYWRALHSPASGKANVYIDGIFAREVDCYSPRSTSWEQFLYIRKDLSSQIRHSIEIVAIGKKHVKSSGTAISHVAFEFSAESYKASAGFSGLMGKNNWHYRQGTGSKLTELTFTIDEDHPKFYWSGSGGCRIGRDYAITGDTDAVRTWAVPHGGTVRIEGTAACPVGMAARIYRNDEIVWPREATSTMNSPHDFELTLIQGDELSFIVSDSGNRARSDEERKVIWDPVITYTKSVPPVWQSNRASARDLARHKYARSKVLVSSYCPFYAVDGDLNTSFTIHVDDRLSTGDDWLEVDLEQTCMIDNYVVCSQATNPPYRVTSFTLQKSDDRFHWTDVDTVSSASDPLEHYYGIPMTRVARTVPAFRARYVRIYLPRGKPFTISGFELYYTEGKTSFGPPIPAG